MAIRQEFAFQHLVGEDVRYLRHVWRDSPNSHWDQQGHTRHGFRCLRGHLRCQERCGPSLRLQLFNRYLIVFYYQHAKMSKKFDQRMEEEELTKLQEKYGVSTKDK